MLYSNLMESFTVTTEASDRGVSAHSSASVSLLSPRQHIHEIISKVKRAHVSTGEQLPGHWGNLALDTWYRTPFASVVFWD